MKEDAQRSSESWRVRTNMALVGFSLVGGLFLISDHWAHVLPYLPWLLLAACPLMHIFMHGSHGHGAQEHSEPSRQSHVGAQEGHAPLVDVSEISAAGSGDGNRPTT